MKVHKSELETFKAWSNSKAIETFTPATESMIKNKISELQRFESNKPQIHYFLELVPFIILFLLWLFLLLVLPQLISGMWLAFSLVLLHGVWGYSFVVYSLHQGVGHGLLKG